MQSHVWLLSHFSHVQLCDPMDCSPAGSSVCGTQILQARILEWIAITFSRGSSQPRDWTLVSCIDRQILYHCTTWEAQIYKKIINMYWKSSSWSSSKTGIIISQCKCVLKKGKYLDLQRIITNWSITNANSYGNRMSLLSTSQREDYGQ